MTDAASGASAAGQPDLTRLERGRTWRNWGRSVTAHPRFAAAASSVDEVRQAVLFARERGLPVKPIGAGHSFSPIAATGGVQLDIAAIDGVLDIERLDDGGALVTFGAGTNIFQLPSLLAPYGLAMQNLGDIDRQTLAGAISTGTHGTGLRFGGLATRVRGAKLVTADGALLTVSATENADLLPAVALGLGALGILVEVTLELVPAFALRAVERREPLAQVLDEWEARIEDADHFEFYTWPHADGVQTKTNTRLPADAPLEPLSPVKGWVDDVLMSNSLYRGLLGLGAAIPATVPTINRAAAALVAAREFSDHSQAVFTSPRTFRFREMEYAVPVEAIPDVVRAVHRLIDQKGWRISMPIEARAAAADDLWLSTAHGRRTGYVAIHRFASERLGDYFREVEPIFIAHDGRPHWGKMHYRSAASLADAYPRFEDFLAVRDRLDPDRVFSNGYLRQVLGT